MTETVEWVIHWIYIYGVIMDVKGCICHIIKGLIHLFMSLFLTQNKQKKAMLQT